MQRAVKVLFGVVEVLRIDKFIEQPNIFAVKHPDVNELRPTNLFQFPFSNWWVKAHEPCFTCHGRPQKEERHSILGCWLPAATCSRFVVEHALGQLGIAAGRVWHEGSCAHKPMACRASSSPQASKENVCDQEVSDLRSIIQGMWKKNLPTDANQYVYRSSLPWVIFEVQDVSVRKNYVRDCRSF